MLINLNEPATWFSEPNDEGMSFTALEHALIYAMAVPAANCTSGQSELPSAHCDSKGHDLRLGCHQAHVKWARQACLTGFESMS
jgi:hypothetical protein